MSESLWPEFPTEGKPRGMGPILYAAGSDIADVTRGAIQFQVKQYTDGDKVQYDCSLTVPRVGYQALLFRVISGVAPFPAMIVFPNGQVASNIQNEATLREVLKQHFHSNEVRDTVQNLLSTFAAVPEPAG